MSLSTAIATWMRQQAGTAGARGFVVGLSGGLDSAVVARLAQLAIPGGMVAALLPCHSDPQDEVHARLVADRFAMSAVRVDLDVPYDALVRELLTAADALPPPVPPRGDDLRAQVPVANVKPRLRMAALYFLANSLDYMVAGTGNRCELAIGYFTKYGDGGVDLLPLGRLLKSEVRALARELDVPDEVVDRPPSAGLWQGQADEAEMGFRYADLETYLTEGPQEVAPAIALKIERLIRASEHKRALPPVFEPEA